MVWLQVQAQAKAEQRYRLLSCPGSAAAAKELGAALATEQLVQPEAEGAAAAARAAVRVATAALAAAIAAAERGEAAATTAADKRAKYSTCVHCNKLK